MQVASSTWRPAIPAFLIHSRKYGFIIVRLAQIATGFCMPESKKPSAKQAIFVNAETIALNKGLCAFLDSSPSPFHATRMLGHMLAQAGFSELDESEDWQLQPGQKYFVTRNQSSLVAWQQGDTPLVESGWRMLGAHTDSPCLKLKPRPELIKHDTMQLGVEVYGGALLNPWFDRDLSIAGRVHYLDSKGELRASLLDFARPLAVIPSLAIHLDREVNKNRTINAQDHLPALIGAAQPAAENDFLQLLAEELPAQWQRDNDASARKHGLATILDHELLLYDTQRAVMQGLRGEYIA
ncbi:MAG: hypothetical protein HKO71_07705, partial [Pseudomonadales bacterium]|nr:hypothetical protein [Pseudomonadales bacterium]